MLRSLVGSEMCIRDRFYPSHDPSMHELHDAFSPEPTCPVPPVWMSQLTKSTCASPTCPTSDRNLSSRTPRWFFNKARGEVSVISRNSPASSPNVSNSVLSLIHI
eukprot:TRINITY_DN24368_c0_g1_i1.p1 TRINITY_DN24368_c0_g1~~TRINITY_DN24368_c0_g1_i1.p1  ORF type:complete len:105 (+),score=12.32 TRINITY_DN24368_c0_g1_i1:168-482(+)